MNLAVYLPHTASWAAFFMVVARIFAPTKSVALGCARSGPVDGGQTFRLASSPELISPLSVASITSAGNTSLF